MSPTTVSPVAITKKMPETHSAAIMLCQKKNTLLYVRLKDTVKMLLYKHPICYQAYGLMSVYLVNIHHVHSLLHTAGQAVQWYSR